MITDNIKKIKDEIDTTYGKKSFLQTFGSLEDKTIQRNFNEYIQIINMLNGLKLEENDILESIVIEYCHKLNKLQGEQNYERAIKNTNSYQNLSFAVKGSCSKRNITL